MHLMSFCESLAGSRFSSVQGKGCSESLVTGWPFNSQVPDDGTGWSFIFPLSLFLVLKPVTDNRRRVRVVVAAVDNRRHFSSTLFVVVVIPLQTGLQSARELLTPILTLVRHEGQLVPSDRKAVVVIEEKWMEWRISCGVRDLDVSANIHWIGMFVSSFFLTATTRLDHRQLMQGKKSMFFNPRKRK